MRGFTDSRNRPDFSPSQEYPRSRIFSTIDKATFAPILSLAFFSFCRYPLFSGALSMPSSLPLVASKLDDTRKFAVAARFLPHLPSYPPITFSEAGPRDRGRLVVRNFGARAQPAILFHVVRPRAPPRGVTYEKRRNPAARKTFMNSLRNELERRLLVLRRTCVYIYEVSRKNSTIELLGLRCARLAVRARMKMGYIKQ